MYKIDIPKDNLGKRKIIINWIFAVLSKVDHSTYQTAFSAV
jgi:hypothetical protein